MSFFYEQALTPSRGSFADGVAGFSELAFAARDAAWYADNMAASDAAIEDAYDKRNDAIFKATGQHLENPYRQHFAAVRGRSWTGADFGAQWQSTVAKLQDNHPDLANEIRAHVPIRDEAKSLAFTAGTRFDEAAASRGDFAGKWAAILDGGFAGSLRDPLQVGTLMLGGGAGTARNTAVRVLEVAGKEAAVNGAVETLMQPMVQAWREQAGLHHGFDQAMFNVLAAAGMGAVFGGALEGAATAVRSLLPGKTPPTLRQLPPEVRGAWHAAEADAFTAAMRPGGMTPEQHDAHVAEALRFAEHQKEFAGVPLHQVATQGDLKRPVNVVEFIASLGGLRDDAGELAARNIDIRTSMTRFGPFMRRKGEMVEGPGLFEGAATGRTGKGLSADEIREKLVEAGYLDDQGLRSGGEATTSATDIYELIDMHLQGKTVVARGDESWQMEVDAKKHKRHADFELERYGDDAWMAQAHGTVIADEAMIQRMMRQNDEADAIEGKGLDVGLATLPVDVDANGKVITYGDFITELESNRRSVQSQGRGRDRQGREGSADGQLENSGGPREAAGEGNDTSLNDSAPAVAGGVDDPLDGKISQWVDDIIASEKLVQKVATKTDVDIDTTIAAPSGLILSPFDDLPGERSLDELLDHAGRSEHLSQLVEACKAV